MVVKFPFLQWTRLFLAVGTTNYDPGTDLQSDEATPQAHVSFISGQHYHNSTIYT
jgi:hypothetical protein